MYSKKEVLKILSEFNNSIPWSDETSKHCTYGKFIREKGLLDEPKKRPDTSSTIESFNKEDKNGEITFTREEIIKAIRGL